MNSPVQIEIISEKSNTQKFWLKLIRDVFGIIKPEDYVEFEKSVLIGKKKFIDAFIPSTGIVIEQKSSYVDLSKPEKQSDGSMLTPFQQAKRYYDWLPMSQKGRYVLTCNFKEIHVHNMETPSEPPPIIKINKVTRENLGFLLVPGETLHRDVQISIKAGQHVRTLYDYLLKSLDEISRANHYDKEQYNKARDDINVFCVRLVFLLYAEDSGLFKRKKEFTDYLKKRASAMNEVLKELFAVLRTEENARDPYISKELKAFPYVDGGLFYDDVRFPQLDDKAKSIILNDMAEFNWEDINPTIFGAIFEATLNDETRKQEGIHYTSTENIHKVIDPLFLDGLREELEAIIDENESPQKTQKLLAFQERLSALRFLDPACGSGNFLTESFTSLRRLENSILYELPEDAERSVKVSITQFHGIEVLNFAVNIARTALWISDHQMWQRTQDITHSNESRLPLVDYHHIKQGSAMEKLENLGWKLPGWKIEHEDMLYIMGNPPFLGYSRQSKGQRDDVESFFGPKKQLDYVLCWFAMASDYLQEKNVKAAFVATNSITQGEQVGYIKPMIKRWNIKIDFAYLPFVWKNELPDPSKMARVHVVIIGFSTNPPEKRRLYSEYKDKDGKINTRYREVDNINFYLHEGPDEDIAESREITISENAPEMTLGSMPIDDGNLIMTLAEMRELVNANPKAEKFIRPFMGADDFIQRVPRYCLWLVGANPDDIRECPKVYKRVKMVQAFREASKRKATLSRAKYPSLFGEIRYCSTRYIAIPKTSSEKRYYIPMDWLTPDVIPGDGLRIIPNATLYHFGVLTSRVHMAWVRRVGGRLKSDYRYSNEIVYNTFAWPSPTPKQRARIEETAQKILDARSLYPSANFSGLYDDTFMPPELRRAHRDNDRAVCRAYGWNVNISEDDIVRELFKLYHALT